MDFAELSFATKVHISFGETVIGQKLSADKCEEFVNAQSVCYKPQLRKWNWFDTLVVGLQWADYAAEMMPINLAQSGNLGSSASDNQMTNDKCRM